MIKDEELRQLAASGEFQELLQNDMHIKKLEASKYKPRDEFIALSDVLALNPSYGSLKLHVLTPAVWAYLWVIQSPYTGEIAKADDLDTDIFMYLLAEKLRNMDDASPASVVPRAIGFCARNGIDPQEAKAWLSERILFAFRPLQMLPETEPQSGGENIFDADWLTRLCSIVAQETGERVSVVMHDMGLGCCCYYFIQALRKKDRKNLIHKRTDEELAKQIYERTLRLAEKFLVVKAGTKGGK